MPKRNPGSPRRLWCDVALSEVATAERRFAWMVARERARLHGHDGHSLEHRGFDNWHNGGRFDKTGKAIANPGPCPAAIEWGGIPGGTGLWYPCTHRVFGPRGTCWSHGGYWEGDVPKDCDDTPDAMVTLDLGHLTVGDLLDAMRKIEKLAGQVNAPITATVELDTNAVRLRGEGGHTKAAIRWNPEP